MVSIFADFDDSLLSLSTNQPRFCLSSLSLSSPPPFPPLAQFGNSNLNSLTLSSSKPLRPDASALSLDIGENGAPTPSPPRESGKAKRTCGDSKVGWRIDITALLSEKGVGEVLGVRFPHIFCRRMRMGLLDVEIRLRHRVTYIP